MGVETVSLFFALLTVGVQATVVAAAALFIGGRFSASIAELGRRGAAVLADSALWLAWLVALVATLGSLYYSEVAGFIPCELCWYQRIAYYPFALILLVAAWRRDANIHRYVLPVVTIGGAISIFHYLLQVVPTIDAGACGVDVSCAGRWVWQFGYISMPMMALSGFALIALLVLITRSAED